MQGTCSECDNCVNQRCVLRLKVVKPEDTCTDWLARTGGSGERRPPRRHRE